MGSVAHDGLDSADQTASALDAVKVGLNCRSCFGLFTSLHWYYLILD